MIEVRFAGRDGTTRFRATLPDVPRERDLVKFPRGGVYRVVESAIWHLNDRDPDFVIVTVDRAI